MARPLRVEYEGAIYHVTVRGNGRRAIFLDDRDRRRFLVRLSDCLEAHTVRLYLFCLMSNHVHLMLETPAGNLSGFMHRLQTAYSVYFNRRHGRSGHLTQGRYGARVVRGEEYLLRLSRYIHLNPVFVRGAKQLPVRERIARLRKYPWSSYRSYIGRAAPPAFVEHAPMLAMVDAAATLGESAASGQGGQAERRRTYRRFVESAIAKTDEDLRRVMAASPLAIGSESFVQWVRQMHEKLLGRHGRAEDVALRRRSRRLPVERVLAIVCGRLGVDRAEVRRRQRGSLLRPIAAKMLCQYAGLTQRQAADLLGLSTGAAVSMQLKSLAAAAAAQGKLPRQLTAIEEAIEGEIN